MMTLREKELEARVVYLEALVATNKKQNSSIAYQFESILTPLAVSILTMILVMSLLT